MAIQCALVLRLVRSIDIKNSSAELFAVRSQLFYDIQMSGPARLSNRFCSLHYEACCETVSFHRWLPLISKHLEPQSEAFRSIAFSKSANSRRKSPQKLKRSQGQLKCTVLRTRRSEIRYLNSSQLIVYCRLPSRSPHRRAKVVKFADFSPSQWNYGFSF